MKREAIKRKKLMRALGLSKKILRSGETWTALGIFLKHILNEEIKVQKQLRSYLKDNAGDLL